MSINMARNNSGHIRLIENESEVSEGKKQKKRLEELYNRLSVREEFYEGQIVKWKTGLHNRKRPYPDEPAIVTKILKKPVYDPSENNSASQFFREPLDVVIGIWDEGDFNELHVDSRRLEPYSQ